VGHGLISTAVEWPGIEMWYCKKP